MGMFAGYSNNFSQKAIRIVLVTILQILLIGAPSFAQALSTVNLTLNEGSAAEFAQVPGTFTVSRTDDGNITQSLTVRMTITGNANWDADYSRPGLDWAAVDANTFRVQIPANQFSQTIILTPKLDNQIEGDETIDIQLKDYGVAYTAIENTIDLVIADFVELMFRDSFEEVEP